MEDERMEVPSTSDLSTTRSIWKGVWGLCVPNRVKTLLWRAGSNSLPSLENLNKRKIALDDLCPGCKLKGESTLHALWSCLAIASAWTSKFDWLRDKTSSCLSMLDVIQCCQGHCDRLDLFAMILAQLWTRRNKLRSGEVAAPMSKIVGLATDGLQEFQRALSVPQPAMRSVSSDRWTPPPSGWLKINFDGATFKVRKLVGLGGVIRNDNGLIMAVFT